MNDIESKKLAPLLILEILKKNSDFNHPITQEEIINYLDNDYGVKLERKAIGRNVQLLIDAGYEIETSKKGTYFDGQLLDDSEIHLVIDSILASKHISESQSKSLINRISTLSNKYFKKHIKNIYSLGQRDKTESNVLFLNIEIIDEAIEKDKQIKYDYNKYGIDKQLHKTSTQIISPYQLLLHNQRYYLMGYSDYWKHIVYHRLDRISNMEIIDEPLKEIRTIKGYENGIDYKKLSTQMPYFNSTEEPINISFYADEWIIDQVIDWFGKDIDIKKEKEKVKVTIKALPTPTKYWLLQYIEHITIINPSSLANSINNLLKGDKDE